MGRTLIREAIYARPQNRCVICGPENPRGLHLEFHRNGDEGVEAVWVAARDWEGYDGFSHGGVLSALLDEAMSKAVMVRGWKGMTCELKVRYRHFVATGEELHIKGWVAERRKRRVLAEASLCTPDGEERVHAWGTFLTVE